MKILIFGGSGSGTTTLGEELQKKTTFRHLDVDNYYWQLTNPPYQEKRPLKERNNALKLDLEKHENVIVTGSLVSWGNEWIHTFDLAIFIYLNPEMRIKRLLKREKERYGDKLFTDKKTQKDSKAFLDWARNYDTPNFLGRSLKIHNKWIELLQCPVLRIDGEFDLNSKVDKVLLKIGQ